MGGFADFEIPLLVMLFYLFRDVEPLCSNGHRVLALNSFVERSTRKTTLGGEFGWGGTSVKQ